MCAGITSASSTSRKINRVKLTTTGNLVAVFTCVNVNKMKYDSALRVSKTRRNKRQSAKYLRSEGWLNRLKRQET